MFARRTATPEKKQHAKSHEFALEAPGATQVVVTGSFCGWQASGLALKKDKKGVWRAKVSLAPGRHEYRFVVDGVWRDDPACTEHATNPYGTDNCVLYV
jgi:1,4-alpha-glucan branching enzyme